jgi:hypothetical protein
MFAPSKLCRWNTWCDTLRRVLVDRSGNTLVIVAAAIAPLLAMVGGGVDMGRSYLSQSRLQQACDAGVLAARKRLGSEAAVTGEIPALTAEIGQRFFNINFRSGAYGTENRDFVMTLEEDFAISGVATVDVPTTLMQVFGFTNVPIKVECEAQINFPSTDVMMVLDVTGSMGRTNPGDSSPRLAVMKETVSSFHAQLAAAAQAGARVRYGFVPYSTNVNVLHLLKDEWVVDEWEYQSRKSVMVTSISTATRYSDATRISGTRGESTVETYPASFSETSGYHCASKPADAVTKTERETNTRTQLTLSPVGTRTTTTIERTQNGTAYEARLAGQQCTVVAIAYTNYVDRYDRITEPALRIEPQWKYAQYLYDVSDWRTASNGCIEERATYEIDNYGAVDLNRALDLNLDLVPGSDPRHTNAGLIDSLLGIVGSLPGLGGGDDDDDDDDDEGGDGEVSASSTYDISKWRPMYPGHQHIRAMRWDGSGDFQQADVTTPDDFLTPVGLGTASCPAPARKLATMTAEEVEQYLATLEARGNTYHDIGMIWGGRLLSPTGLFAAENGDVPGSPTSRHLIFLTDGETAPLDVSYSSYGIEPLDQRRWSPGSSLSLTQTIEQRFQFTCGEVKRRNITVWIIGFGTVLSDVMRDCAGEGHYFEAADAAELNASFATIADSISDLRVSR